MLFGSVADPYSIAHTEMLTPFDLRADTAPTTPLKELQSESFSPNLHCTGLKERMTP